mgnify:CR=1 FL=1
MKPRTLKILFNIYPPFICSGIKVKKISDDFKFIRVEMKLKWYNRNYVGTHFGGSLFSMTDPFLMVMLMNILGKEYIVWDKSTCIEFIRPGLGTVKAEFRIIDENIRDIIEKTSGGEKYYPEFNVEILNERNEVVSRIKKILYVKKKI